MIICTDITKAKNAQIQVEKEQEVLRRIIELHERDRRILAYDVHDGFAQLLTGTLFRFQSLGPRFQENPVFQTGVETLRECLNETRRLINGLRPPVLDEMGLVAALEHLAFDMMDKCPEDREGGPMQVDIRHHMNIQTFPPPVTTTVFRIVQEALTNAFRHSESPRCQIRLTQDGKNLSVLIQDWGTGFVPEEIKPARFGLQGIRERVRLLGGKLQIDSKPDKGTTILATFPLPEATEEQGVSETER